MFDSNHVQNDFIYQTGGSILPISRIHGGGVIVIDSVTDLGI
jgi:hypothetical protein